MHVETRELVFCVESCHDFQRHQATSDSKTTGIIAARQDAQKKLWAFGDGLQMLEVHWSENYVESTELSKDLL